MRSVSASLETWLDTHTVGIYRHLVTITTRGGTVARWTDHHADLTISRPARPGDSETSGTPTFTAGGTGTVPIIRWGYREEFAGTAIGSLDMVLFCGTSAQFDGVRLPVAATNRMLDGAIVKVERVYGEASLDLSLGAMHIFEGVVAEARPSSTAVELELECGLATLNVEVPRKLYRPGCTNILFDGQCGLSKATYTVAGTVSAATTTMVQTTSWASTTGYFDLGVLTFTTDTTTAALRGVQRAVRAHVASNSEMTLDRPLPVAPVSGDTFTVYPGCPKTLGACETKFGTDNRARFRGCPYIPRQHKWISNIATVPEGGVLQVKSLWKEPAARPVPIIYGKTRIGGTAIDSIAGPMGVWTTLIALCEGPIVGVDWVYQPDNITAFTALPWRTLRAGTRPTATAIPGRGNAYPGIAIVNELTGSTNYAAMLLQEYEVKGILSGTGGSAGDADPAKVILDLLGRDPTTGNAKTEDPYGAQFQWPVVTTAGLDGNAASSISRYVSQAEFWISIAITEERQALDVLEEICEAINAEPLWKEGQLYIVPRADTVLSTFSPVISVRYAFGADDLIPDGGDLVRVTLDPETESYNICPVTFHERAPEGVEIDGTLAYQDATEEDPDPIDVALRGERRAGAVRLPAITLRDHAVTISRILAQRSVRTRQEIKFSTGFRFARLEPLDLVTVTDAVFPFTSQPFQARKIKETIETGVITVEGQEWTAGVNHATAHVTQSSDGATSQWETYDPETRLHEAALANLSAKTIPATGNYYAIANIGEGKWAAVGNSVAAYSADGGETWNAGTIPAGTYYGIAYDPATGAIVAVGASVCARSTNGGATYTAQTIPAGTYRAITWAAGLSLFVAVGDSSACASSPTGVTWTGRTIATGTYYGVAWAEGMGLLVAVGASGVVATSPNATTWTAQTSGTTGTLSAVAYSPTRGFVAVGDGARWSIDAVTWTDVPTADVPWGSNTRAYGITWDGYLFVVVGGTPIPPAAPLIATSRDGQRWANSTIRSPAGLPYAAVAEGDGRCVLVGGLLGATCAASQWTAGAIPTW